jgi:hypothetical protein
MGLAAPGSGKLVFLRGFVIVYSSHYTVRITFAYDKRARKARYKVRHGNIKESEFEEVLSRAVVVFGQRRQVLKAVGRTAVGRFLTVVFIRVSNDMPHFTRQSLAL